MEVLFYICLAATFFAFAAGKAIGVNSWADVVAVGSLCFVSILKDITIKMLSS